MKNTDFFTDLLGITKPWFIDEISLNQKAKRVDIFIDHIPGIKFLCPECKANCSVYDHSKERIFRHLNTCQMQTYIHVRFPRVNCKHHGIKQVESGLGDENSAMTYEFEEYIINMEHECSIQSVTRIAKVDWHSCWMVMEKSVERGFARKKHRIPTRIGVDEKSFAKGHKYETLVYNIDRGCVEYVVDKRDQASLESYYKRFNYEDRKDVNVVTMDMWDPYIAATKAYIPNAEKKIVFDRYHVMKQVVDAVDKTRKEEHKYLKAEGNDILKGTRYLWLWSNENMPKYRHKEFEVLRSKDLKVCRAWAIKENLRHLWDYCYEGCMRKYFADWYRWATHSRLEAIIKSAKTLKRHLDNIVTYARKRITNALGESLNSKIEKVKRLACGFRNREHYKIAIYFHCGGLDLFPKRLKGPLQIVKA